MAPMATRVRAWLAAAASRHPAPSAQRPNAIAFSPSPSSLYVPASAGDERSQRLAALIVPGFPERLAEQPLGLGQPSRGERHRAQHAAAQRGRRGLFHCRAQRQAAGFLRQHQVQRRGQQPPLPVGAGRGYVRGPPQAGGGQRQPPGGRLARRQPLQFGRQPLIRLFQRGHPVLPRRRVADHLGRPGVQHPAPGRRDARVDCIPDRLAADHHRATGLFRRPVHQPARHCRLDRRARRAGPSRRGPAGPAAPAR